MSTMHTSAYLIFYPMTSTYNLFYGLSGGEITTVQGRVTVTTAGNKHGGIWIQKEVAGGIGAVCGGGGALNYISSNRAKNH
jgi:hypothetical protein